MRQLDAELRVDVGDEPRAVEAARRGAAADVGDAEPAHRGAHHGELLGRGVDRLEHHAGLASELAGGQRRESRLALEQLLDARADPVEERLPLRDLVLDHGALLAQLELVGEGLLRAATRWTLSSASTVGRQLLDPALERGLVGLGDETVEVELARDLGEVLGTEEDVDDRSGGRPCTSAPGAGRRASA